MMKWKWDELMALLSNPHLYRGPIRDSRGQIDSSYWVQGPNTRALFELKAKIPSWEHQPLARYLRRRFGATIGRGSELDLFVMSLEATYKTRRVQVVKDCATTKRKNYSSDEENALFLWNDRNRGHYPYYRFDQGRRR